WNSVASNDACACRAVPDSCPRLARPEPSDRGRIAIHAHAFARPWSHVMAQQIVDETRWITPRRRRVDRDHLVLADDRAECPASLRRFQRYPLRVLAGFGDELTNIARTSCIAKIGEGGGKLDEPRCERPHRIEAWRDGHVNVAVRRAEHHGIVDATTRPPGQVHTKERT